MPTSTPAQIRAGIAAAIVTGVGSGWQVSAYMLFMPQPPAIDIRPSGTDYDVAMARGEDQLTFTIRAMVAANVDQGAQIMLDTLLDTTDPAGMKTAIEADLSLGGLVSDLRLVSASDYRALITDGSPPMLAVEFMLEVLR